jgi:L-ribulose-5-phosphate 3-epimerase
LRIPNVRRVEYAAIMPKPEPNPISLAQWSLHRTIGRGELDPIDFPRVTREVYGLDAVEYVNSFYRKHAGDMNYFKLLRRRCDELAVRSLLVMVDGEGALGDVNEKRRAEAVQNHVKWLDAARVLGCHSIRVNAGSGGTFDEQLARAADGLGKLGAIAEGYGLNVLVENHGGLSSNGAWLAAVMKRVDRANVGTLPDFGNFHLGGGKWYDRSTGVKELMPFAKAVSAKSHEFDASGNESKTDYPRMMQIVRDAGYTGYVGIEWEGGSPDEEKGILLTKAQLERCGCVARG